MNFILATLRVNNLEESIEFYQDIIGFKWSTGFDRPIQPNLNTKFIFIKDPNGMKIQLVEN